MTYCFYCDDCGIQVDISKFKGKFHPSQVRFCPVCSWELVRDYSRENKSVHFKGEGFYSTDNKEN